MISVALRAFHEHARGAGFVGVTTSQITPFPTEDTTRAFPIDYLGRTAYLAQSGRRYHQLLLSVFPRVYEVRPAYWAIPADDGSALTQFTTLELAESLLTTDSDGVEVMLDAVEAVVRTVTTMVDGHPSPTAWFDWLAGTPQRYLPGQVPKGTEPRWWILMDGGPFGAPFPAPDRPGSALIQGTRAVATCHRHDSDARQIEEELLRLGADAASRSAFVEGVQFGPPSHLSCTVVLELLLAGVLDQSDLRRLALFPRDRAIVTP